MAGSWIFEMAALDDTVTISARGRVLAGAAETFTFLAGPSTHRRLQVRGIASLSLERDYLVSGGAIVLRGPLGLQRTIRTRIALRQPPTRLAGSAVASSGTVAHVSWTLRAQPDSGTLVELTAVLGPIARGDRLLLALGGRRWIRRLFAATLRRLAAELKRAPGGTAGSRARALRSMAIDADPSGVIRHPLRLRRERAPFDTV